MPKSLPRRRNRCADNPRFAPLVVLLLLCAALPASLPQPSAAQQQDAASRTRANVEHRRPTHDPRGATKEATTTTAQQSGDEATRATARERLDRAYGRLPLTFEANQGQSDERVKFIARGSGYALFLTPDEAVLKLRGGKSADDKDDSFEPSPSSRTSELRLRLVNAKSSPAISASGEQRFKSNHFNGDDARRWRSNVANYERVKYEAVYQGIDLVYYGNQQQLEYDFHVAPKANPARIKFAIKGAQRISLDASGDLLLTTHAGVVRQRKPYAYQEIGGTRREVAARYYLDARRRVGFKLGAYDRSRPLVIDPVLLYSTFLGGNSIEEGAGVALDAQGNAYVAGSTLSTDFPWPSPIQNSKSDFTDTFILKLNAAGTALVYATYLGGNGDDIANAIAIDSQGNAYITGSTGSGSFPRTAGAFQQTAAGGLEAFAAKISADGSTLLYSTFLGGNNTDQGFAIAADSQGHAYIAGVTDSTDFLTPNAPDAKHGSPAFKSVNQGGLWSATENGLTARAVNGLTIDPSNANTIYAASSNGVFKSTDGGNLWRLTGTTRTSTSPRAASAVAVDPTNANTIYVGGTGRIHKSTNGGDLYDVKSQGLFDAVNALLIDPSAPATLYAGTARGVYKSTDGGETWNIFSTALTGTGTGTNYLRVNELAFHPATPATIYAATNSGVYKTTGGAWSPLNNGLGSPFFPPDVSALAIDPLNPLNIYAGLTGFVTGVYKTTDGGANWTAASVGLTPAPVLALAVDPSTPATIYAGTNSAAIYKSTNGGDSWSAASNGLTSRIVYALAVDPKNPAKVYAGTEGSTDAFVVKLNPAGSLPAYFMYLGGDDSEGAGGIAVNAQGDAYVVGTTSSTNFPTVNAFQPTLGGLSDVYLTRINATGSSLVYATYLGGSRTDSARDVALDAAGNAYLTGSTNSTDFPTLDAFQPNLVEFSTDAFVSKLAADGSALLYSTYLGGFGTDNGISLAVDAGGSAYVTGFTTSQDFPVASAVQAASGGGTDAFVSKLAVNGSTLVYSTYLGGVSSDRGNGIAVDSSGNAYVVGTTSSHDFRLVNPLQPTIKAQQDAFIAKIGPSVNLSLSITDAPDPVAYGNQLTYTINVANEGEVPANGVTLINILPQDATLVSATPAQGSCISAGFVTCNLGTLNGGASTTVSIVILPPAVREIINMARVSSDEIDGVPENNADVETTQVNFSELSVTGSTGFGRVAHGALVNYLYKVTNNSGGLSEPVTLSGTLPSGMTFVSCSATGGACSNSGNNWTASFASLAVGQTVSVVLVASVDTSVPEGTLLSHTAAIASASVDPDTSNNTTTSAVTVTATPLRRKLNGRVAFSSGRIYTAKADASEPPALFSAPLGSIVPRWSPDGAKLAYIVSKTKTVYPYETYYVIEVANADGTNPLVVADNSTDTSFDNRSNFSWSPDGSRIAYVGKDRTIHIANADGSGYMKLPNSPAQVKDIDWSPDGSRFLFSKDFGEIYSMRVDGGNLTKLVALSTNADGPTRYTGPVWSPDMSKILYVQRSNNFSDIYIMNADGSGAQRLLNRNSTSAPTWSPDGMKLAFYHGTEVHVIDLDGANDLTLATNETCCNSGAISWQPIPTTTPLPLPGPSAQTFNISGRITSAANNNPIVFTTVTLSGTRNATINADVNGNYTFVNLPSGGNYTVTPSDISFTFSPASRNFDNLNANQTAEFVGTFVPANITGRITDNNGQPLAGIKVTSSGGFPVGSTHTDSQGFYSFLNLQRRRSYSIFPDPFSPYQFAPEFILIQDLTTSQVVNFVGTKRPANTIGGRVVEAVTGNGIAGVPVSLAQNGNAAGTTFTDAQGNYSFGERAAGNNYWVSVSFDALYTYEPAVDAPNPFAQIQIPNLTSNQHLVFKGTKRNTVVFTSAGATVTEEGKSLVVSVTRTGITSSPATVNYSTGGGTASEISDYSTALGTLRFAASETSKTFQIFITDDAFDEATETINLRLEAPLGATLGAQSTATVQITDNDAATGPSPVRNGSFDSQFFVRQHYVDFFNREPDASGLAFWTGQIDECEQLPEAQRQGCREIRRINVSAAFFVSGEFQETGYLVYRLHQTAFNTGERLPLRDFLSDTQEIGRGVAFGIGDWEQQLENNKRNLLDAFVTRQAFTALYGAMSDRQYVEALNANTGNSLTQAEVNELTNNLTVNQWTRAQVLRAVAEHAELRRRQLNRAFVYMQYVGYMRRVPDASGFEFWLTKLNNHNGNYISAEMVKAFITSGEYEQRFGQ